MPATAVEPPRASVPAVAPPRGLSVLVAADRSQDAEVLALALEAVGCDVASVPLGAATVDLAQVAQPDVVIVVAGGAGWEAVPKGVADRAGWRKPFVVALTPAGSDPATADGVHLAVERPVSPAVLAGIIRRFRALLAGIEGFDPAI